MSWYTAKTDEELEKANLLNDKERYRFRVFDSVRKKSNKGNDMVELVLEIDNKFGEHVKRWVFLNPGTAFEFLIRHFCECTGLIDKYNDHTFDAPDALGKTGELEITHQRDKTGKLRDVVKDFIKPEAWVLGGDIEDKDIPF